MTTARELPVGELRTSLSDAVARANYAGERVIITRHGKPAAALISAEDLRLLEKLEMADDVAAFDAAIAEDDGKHLSLEDYLAED